MKTNVKNSWPLIIGTLSLAGLSLGGNCPGTGLSAKFSSIGDSVSATAAKSWRTAAIMDPNSIDGNTFDQNIILPLGTIGPHSMSVFAESASSFFVMFSRETATGDVSVYGTQPITFATGSWPTTMGGFTLLDTETAADEARNPVTAVDTLGNSVTVYLQDPGGGAETRRVNAVRRLASSAAWISPVDLRASAEVAAAVDVGNESLAIAVDAYNAFVPVWCSSNNILYFNHYRSSVGWRFNTSSTADATWDGASDCDNSLGVDIAFDGYGNGYGAFVTTGDEVKVRRWQGDTAANWLAAGYKDITNGTTACYPRLFMTPDGEGYLFFYTNCAGAAGDLYYSYAAATSTSSPPVSSDFGAAAAFDTGIGTGNAYIQDNGDPIPPILAVNGNYAVIGHIKQDDGLMYRLWVSRYDGNSWSTHTAIDQRFGSVTNAALAINSNGEIAAMYSAVYNGSEVIYVTNYTNGVWKTPTQVSLPGDLVPGNGATARYHPSIAIDASGNAIGTFTMTDTGGNRRAVAVMYR
ncbi:MAG TPA: hypothetical protein PLH57_07065 [Oligoflexia bacterium]|nr:hypothetical protein [Oligoflexia bacterium]